jgi:phosphate-selective porin OprO and OprP
MKTNKQQAKRLIIATVVGAQSIIPAVAADSPATAASGAAEIPAFAADGNSPEAAEIKALKAEVDALVKKVNALEQQRGPAEQAATIQNLDQQVRILQRQRELDQDAAVAKAATAPKISLGQNGFSFSSGDSNFVFQAHGLVQLDSRTFFHDGNVNGNDGFLLRRARPIITGTVFGNFDYNFTPDFGGNTVQIQDAYLNWRLWPEFQVQAGKFKSPVGLEQLQSDPATSFNERSLVTDLVPNRDLGIALKGDLLDGAVSYTAGIFDGAPDYSGTTTNLSFQDDKAFAGRLFFQPWKNSSVNALKGLGFGVGASDQVNHPATNSLTGLTSGYTTDGQQKFFTWNSGVIASGNTWRVSPQAYYYYGPFSLLGEYVVDSQRVSLVTKTGKKSADLQNNAWEVTGGWVLTGEDATYAGVTPLHPFDPRNNQWGALQIVGRFAQLNVDRNAFSGGFANTAKSADTATAWAVGLNWFLNKNIRANLSYSHTTFEGFTGKAAPGVIPAQAENVLFSRLQLSF